MIGGAYWPLEIVESPLLIALSKINPITYGMEVLNGVALYGYPLEELLFPISILILMGVVMTGIGMSFDGKEAYLILIQIILLYQESKTITRVIHLKTAEFSITWRFLMISK